MPLNIAGFGVNEINGACSGDIRLPLEISSYAQRKTARTDPLDRSRSTQLQNPGRQPRRRCGWAWPKPPPPEEGTVVGMPAPSLILEGR